MKLQSLAVEIMRSARAGETSLDLWKGYCDKIKNVIDNLNHSSICSIIHSFGHMRYKHAPLLSILSINLYKNAPFLTLKELTSVIKSFSLLQFKNDFMMQILSKYIAKMAPMMSPYELSTLLYSYATLDSCNQSVYYPIKCAVIDNINKFGPRELTLLLGALSKIKCNDLELMTVVSSHFCKIISNNDPKSLSLSSNYILKFNLKNSKIIATFIAREIMNYKPKFSAQGLSLILNSISKYNDSISIFQRYSMIIQSRINEFNIHSCCLVASAVSRANYKEVKLLESLAERVGKQSSELYPQAVATLTYSFAKLNHLHGPLMYYSGKHLISYLEDYTIDQICMIIKSYFTLHIDDKEVLEFVIVSLRHKWCLDNIDDKFSIKKATTSGLLWIMECFAAFLIVNDDVYTCMKLISEEVKDRVDDMNKEMAICLLHGLSFYQIKNLDLIDRLSNHLGRLGERGIEMSEREARLVKNALETLKN